MWFIQVNFLDKTVRSWANALDFDDDEATLCIYHDSGKTSWTKIRMETIQSFEVREHD